MDAKAGREGTADLYENFLLRFGDIIQRIGIGMVLDVHGRNRRQDMVGHYRLEREMAK